MRELKRRDFTYKERPSDLNREVVVIGAGPTGAVTAASLARQGVDTLLVDRQELGRDKVCGDAWPARAIETLYLLGMEERILEADLHLVNKVIIASPRGYFLEADISLGAQGARAHIIPRRVFDQMIVEHAIDCGVEFRQASAKGLNFKGDQVVGVRLQDERGVYDVSSKVIVGADGATSLVARDLQADVQINRHKAVALRSYVEGINLRPEVVEFYFNKDVLPGYAWIFPLGEEEANVGLGMIIDSYKKGEYNLVNMLDEFLHSNMLEKRLSSNYQVRDVGTWPLPLGFQRRRRAYGGALLAGDAAGLVDPLTGGGIGNGLFSATAAADVIVGALRGQDSDKSLSLEDLQEYDQIINAGLGDKMRKSELIQRSISAFPILADIGIRFASDIIRRTL